ncbi:MAG: hypothetical protein KDC99_19960, partial [Cyclobacteriaceae bacterium]|nr:hypothetical protein [Cyclobacteriaceae bacterium]
MNSEKTIYNATTRITASVLAILLGAAGFINHGLFEILQGNTPTHGMFIDAIGVEHRFWLHGTEAAFTLVPNFLVTGVLVTIVGLTIIIWSARYMHTRHGATVFLLLMILSTLVGGGIGHIVVFLPTWAYATRINKPLSWWDKTLPLKIRKTLVSLWMPMLILTSICWMTVMELGIFGLFPMQNDPDTL